MQEKLTVRPLLTAGELAADPMMYRVTVSGRPVQLTPLAFDVLYYLMANSDRVVGKDELFDAVWAGAFVTDNALTRVVRELRKAIGDKAASPRYIQTLPKRGYRFIGDVTDRIPTPPAVKMRYRLRRPLIVFASVVMAVLLAVPAAIALSELRAEMVAAATPVDSVAILPFETDAPELRTISEPLRARLMDATSSVVRVMPDSSIDRNKLDEDPQIVGRSLGARAVLHGRITHNGEQIVVTLELLDTAVKAHLWGYRSQIPINERPAIEDEAAASLRSFLRKELEEHGGQAH